MMKAIINVILAATLLMLSGCSDSQPESPETIPDTPLSISYSSAGFGEGIHSRAEQHYCDPELNEGKVGKLDLLLVNASGNILARYTTNDTEGENRCDGIEHHLLTVKEDRPEFSRQKIMQEGNRLVLIANLDANLETVTNLNGITKLENLSHNTTQDKFVMTGEVAGSVVTQSGTINIKLERVAAKIRIRLYNPAKSDKNGVLVTIPGSQIQEFESALCHYVKESPVMKEPKALTSAGNTSTVPCHGQEWPDFFANPNPELVLDNGIIKENAHIFYTYPTDWYNYKDNTFSPCTRTHTNETAHKEGESYYTIRNYDDEEPIVANRQVFVIVYAEYESNGNKYYYKVPINYRLSDKNDRQCFSSKELDEDVLSLYRADRNHFYDVTAIIDRPGAGTPEEAINNPMFTATIAPLTDGGTFDYIYD